jgi:hypothetical protein
MDLADRYCARTACLLRMLDNSDLGAYVPEIVKAEIRRVLHLPEEVAAESVSYPAH